jgi:hypothetical protein
MWADLGSKVVVERKEGGAQNRLLLKRAEMNSDLDWIDRWACSKTGRESLGGRRAIVRGRSSSRDVIAGAERGKGREAGRHAAEARKGVVDVEVRTWNFLHEQGRRSSSAQDGGRDHEGDGETERQRDRTRERWRRRRRRNDVGGHNVGKKKQRSLESDRVPRRFGSACTEKRSQGAVRHQKEDGGVEPVRERVTRPSRGKGRKGERRVRRRASWPRVNTVRERGFGSYVGNARRDPSSDRVHHREGEKGERP